ncbi:phytoene dehydrogenase [Nonlabens ulvanivorans]|nr:phytoene dehydrogenase [Nonlabens ulvanivorans]
MSKKIAIIGSGFASLSAASYLAQAGNEVTIYEKTILLVVGLED